MFLLIFTTLLAVGTVRSRDSSKSKAVPSITSSLINLGKMDISFHFNSKDLGSKSDPLHLRAEPEIHASPFSKPEIVAEEPCPCTGLRGFKEPVMGSPSDIINKILMSNDLFSFNKDPLSSTLCCESHEHVQEDIVTFEFGSKPLAGNTQRNSLAPIPLMIDNMMSQKLLSAPSVPLKPKAIEIFLFPKKKDLFFETGKYVTKKDIKAVGEKEHKDTFSNFKMQVLSTPASTVKKDLANQEKDLQNVDVKLEGGAKETTTVVNGNSLQQI